MAGFRMEAGHVAVVTGAASGIGRAIAGECARRGMKVVLADVDTAALDQCLSELAAPGCECLAMRCDVAKEEDCAALAAVVEARFNGVQVLVNCAGVAGPAGRSWAIDAESWDRTLGVNLAGTVNMVRAFLPSMIAAGRRGWVVFVGSLAGLLPAAGAAPYGVSKAALIAYAEALSLEIDHIDAAVGITVACPAAVATNLAASLIPMEGTAEDAARAAAEGLAKGMAPQEAARRILAAVEEGRFAVFTHAGTEALVEERIRSLINGQDPTDPDWSRFPAAG